MGANAIILAAGSGSRMGGETPKQFLHLAGKPILSYSLTAFENAVSIRSVVLVTSKDQISRCESEFGAAAGFRKVNAIVEGGSERQYSVAEGLRRIDDVEPVVAIHDGARPFVGPEQINSVVVEAERSGAAVLGTPITDTVKLTEGNRVKETLDRSKLWCVQTPQAFQLEVIRMAHKEAEKTKFLGTDDTALVEKIGSPVVVVPGMPDNIKITTPADLEMGEDILRRRGAVSRTRIGQGYDVHRLTEGRPLILGGVKVPFELGLLGHSDADVLSHAIVDALLGAIGAGDIGRLFPDTDDAFEGISSLILLERVAERIKLEGSQITNVDATVMAQKPKLAPHISEMRENIARSLDIPVDRVSVKATTTEGLGFVGSGEGMAAQAVAMVET